MMDETLIKGLENLIRALCRQEKPTVNSQDIPYFKAYKRIDKRVIELIRTLKVNNYFHQKEHVKQLMIIDLILNLCDIYNIPKVTVSFSNKPRDNDDSCYKPIEHSINLRCASIVTALHEFKHALQHKKGKVNNENVARGWSLSAYYKALPKHFKRAVNKGLILYVDKSQLCEEIL